MSVTFSAWDGTSWGARARKTWDGSAWAPHAPASSQQVLDTLRHVTNNAAWWRIGTDSDPTNGTTAGTLHTVTAPAQELRMLWGVHGWAGTEAVTIRASLTIRGTTYQLTWGGATEVTIAKQAQAVSDPLPPSVTVSAGETIESRTWFAPGKRPSASRGATTAVTGFTVGDATDGGAMVLDRQDLIGPQGIYGVTTSDARSLAVLGDSLQEIGWSRNAADTLGIAWSDLSQWAENIPRSVTAGQSLLSGRLPSDGSVPFSHAFCAYGTNDQNGDLGFAQSNIVAWWQALAAQGTKVGQMTLTPWSTSTDGWTTLGGQTPSTNDAGFRLPWNNWVRDGAPLVDGAPVAPGTTGALRATEPGHPLALPHFDAADVVESSRDSGLWRVDQGALTTDGSHYEQAASDLLQPVFRDWITANVTP